jgi:hypothetical protein
VYPYTYVHTYANVYTYTYAYTYTYVFTYIFVVEIYGYSVNEDFYSFVTTTELYVDTPIVWDFILIFFYKCMIKIAYSPLCIHYEYINISISTKWIHKYVYLQMNVYVHIYVYIYLLVYLIMINEYHCYHWAILD